MKKCDHHTNDCSFVFCKKTRVCRHYFWSLPASEKIAMRLRWFPIMENYTVGDILSSQEFRDYSGVNWEPIIKPEKIKPIHRTLPTPHYAAKSPTEYQKRRIKIYHEYNGICWLCGLPVDLKEFSIDHVRPLSKGGTNAMDNLRPAHKDCNSLKGSHDITTSAEFFAHAIELSKSGKGVSIKQKKLITEFEKARMTLKINTADKNLGNAR